MNEAHGVGQPGWNLDSITPHLQLWRKFTSASHTSVSLSPKKGGDGKNSSYLTGLL